MWRLTKNNEYSQTGAIRVDRGIFNKSSYILRRPIQFDEIFTCYLKLLSSVNCFLKNFCCLLRIYELYFYKSKVLVNYCLHSALFTVVGEQYYGLGLPNVPIASCAPE